MKERQLTMKEFSGERCNLSDAQKDALKKILDFASMTLEIGTIPAEAAGYSSLLESYVIDYCKASGYAGELEKEAEERHQKIRELNIENRELRRQLGEKITSEDARERVKIMSSKLSKWWEDAFSGFVSSTDQYCTGYGYRATLGTSTRIHHAKNRDEIIAKVKEFGIEMVDDRQDDDSYPPFTPANVEKLQEFIRRRFPSAEIIDVDCRKYHCIPPRIAHVEIIIRDCDDFEKEEGMEAAK